MKKNLLIVTEDVIEIQTFSGALGNLFSKTYQLFLKIKLKIAIIFLKKNYSITVLATETVNLSNVQRLNYSSQFDPHKNSQNKPLAQSIYRFIANQIKLANSEFSQFKSIPLFSLWENKITPRLMNYYLSYLEVLTRLIKSGQYTHILVLGKSTPEQIAIYLAKYNNIKLIDLSFTNFNWTVKGLFKYFHQREIANRLKGFKHQAERIRLPLKSLNQSIILSVDFYRHLKTLVPVYQALKKVKANPLLVTDQFGLKNSLSSLKAEASRHIFLASFLPKEVIDSLIINNLSLVRKIESQVARAVLNQRLSPETLILKLVYPEIAPIIQRGLILSRLYLQAGDELFKKIKPKFIVVAADSRFPEITLSKMAKIYNIPSLTISPRFIIFEDEPYKYDLTDYIAVTGENVRNQLIKLGVPIKKLIVSGDPRNDQFIYLTKKFSAQKTLEKLGIEPADKKIVLLISERPNLYFPKNEKKEMFLLAAEAVKKLPNAILVIKPHPTERKFRLEEELKQWKINRAVVSDNKQIELFDLLKLSSAVVMVWSMVGLEAMMLRRPVIIVNPRRKNFDRFIPYLKQKAAVEAVSLKDLEQYLRLYSDNKNKELISAGLKFSRTYIGNSDQSAADKLAKIIINLSD